MRSYIIVDVTRLLIEREQPASFLLVDDAADDVLVSLLPRASFLLVHNDVALARRSTVHTHGSFDELLI